MDRRTISRALPCNSRAKWPNYVSPPGMLGSGEGVAGSGYWPTFFFRDWEEINGTRVFGGEWFDCSCVEFSRYGDEHYGLVCCLKLLMVRGIFDGQENSGQLGGAGYVQGVFKSLGWCTEDVWCIYSENEICRK